MEVKVFDPNLDLDFVNENNVQHVSLLNELVNDIEILCLTLPLNNQTKGIINSKLLLKADKNLVIVNTSRALIVDQKSLIKLLDTNKIKAYLTDVLEEEPMIKNHPLINYDNVIITPHIGSRTFQSVQRQGAMAVENLLKELKKHM